MATKKFIPCGLRFLPDRKQVEAAIAAASINPANRPAGSPTKEELAVYTTKMWPASGVKLGVAFLDITATNLKSRILSHMNAWGKKAEVVFNEAPKTTAEIRIAKVRGDGYWSYLGTDVLFIHKNEPTMNLDSFTMDTPEGEYLRVVRHETGHTLGFPHEHLRKELVNRLDYNKTIAYFQQMYGWPANVTVANVLTPLNESSIRTTEEADDVSVMCYQLPGSITKDGKPIPGGPDINELDAKFCGELYPKAAPPPEDTEDDRVVIRTNAKQIIVPHGSGYVLVERAPK